MTEETGPLPEAAPISVAQEAMFYQSLLAPTLASYNETISIRKEGDFDLDAFRAAFNEIVRRHAAWRTTFEVVSGRPVQVVNDAVEFDLPVLDLTSLGQEAEAHAVRVVSDVSRVPYDLRRGPLLRPRLIKFACDHHRLYLAMHHLIFDGVSVYRVVLPELAAIYEAFRAGRPSPLAEPSTSYVEYARWEQEWVLGQRACKRLEFWHSHLESAPLVSLPLDRRRRDPARLRGAIVSLEVEADVATKLHLLAQGVGATLFQVLAAAWAVVLRFHSGVDDVVFSTAADLRQRPEFESVVGCSLTPLVLRVGLGDEQTFAELVVRTRNEVLDGLEHLVPFERIVRECNPPTPAGANPVYQTMVVLEPPMVVPDPSWSIHQMEPEIGDRVGATKLDLELGLDERPDGVIDGRLVYDSDLFDHETVERIANRWSAVLRRVAQDPTVTIGSLFGADEEGVAALADWNATTTSFPFVTVTEMIAAQARLRPNAPAVFDGEHGLTYGELEARAATTAQRLRTAGLGRGDVVALCANPSVELVASALGVLQTGAAYLLLDPGLPVDCLENLIDEAGAAIVYAAPALASLLTGTASPIRAKGVGTDAPGAGEDGAAPCCIQFLDPSGAQPGYALSNRAIVALCSGLAADVGLGPADTALVLSETLYRASAIELWMPLSAGARIVLAPPSAAEDGRTLSRLVAAEHVSFLHAFPARWRELVDSGMRPARGLCALSGAVGLSEDLADAICDRSRVLVVGFGGPETTMYATWGTVDRTAPLTIGRPGANTRAYVLDEFGNALPPGAVGRLLIGGECVATVHPLGAGPAGPAPFEPGGGGRAVATGRQARWRRDGNLELVPVRAELQDR